jgi:glycosyltransferase involved in cell wall biosynthesis
LKVLFIHNKYQQAGGEDVAVEEEMKLLQQKGHTTDVIYFDNTAIQSTYSKIKAGFGAVYNQQSFKILENKISDNKPDLIHIHNLFFTASPSVLYAAAKKNIPVVATIHNYRLVCANALLMRNNAPCELCVTKTLPLAGIIHRCYRSSVVESALVTAVTGFHKLSGTWRKKIDQYIALTPFAKEKLLHSSLQLPDHKITVKPNFVTDYGEGETNRENFFLFVGRLSTEKGVDVLLQCFSKLLAFKLIIAGEGPNEKKLKEDYKSYTNIQFVGKKNKTEVIHLMKQCKALIFPSIWYEGQPYTILEAFATGTPVIASKLGAMESMITNNFNGLHFEPGNSNDLCKAITAFNENSSKVKFYANARQTYINNYHPDIHYTSIMKIYTDVMNHNYST